MRLNFTALASAAVVAATIVAAPALASTALTNGAVKLLGGPGSNFDVVTGLDANSKVGVLWCGPASFDWCLVQFHKKQGWLHIADLIGLDAAGEPGAPGSKGGSAGPDGPKSIMPAEAREGTNPPVHIDPKVFKKLNF